MERAKILQSEFINATITIQIIKGTTKAIKLINVSNLCPFFPTFDRTLSIVAYPVTERTMVKNPMATSLHCNP